MRQLDEGAEEIYTKRVSKNKTADEWKSSQLLKAWHCVPKILKPTRHPTNYGMVW